MLEWKKIKLGETCDFTGQKIALYDGSNIMLLRPKNCLSEEEVLFVDGDEEITQRKLTLRQEFIYWANVNLPQENDIVY